MDARTDDGQKVITIAHPEQSSGELTSQKRPCLMIIMRFFSNFIYKGICCGYSFELHRQVDAIQMSTHNICFYKEVKKKYTGCNLKNTEFLDCALIGVCAVIRSNTVNRGHDQTA